VDIQTDTISELSRAEDAAYSLLEGITKYYVTRGKLISKVPLPPIASPRGHDQTLLRHAYGATHTRALIAIAVFMSRHFEHNQVLKHPEIEDYSLSVVELDEKEYLNMRLVPTHCIDTHCIPQPTRTVVV
jgi:hypothetical protein